MILSFTNSPVQASKHSTALNPTQQTKLPQCCTNLGYPVMLKINDAWHGHLYPTEHRNHL